MFLRQFQVFFLFYLVCRLLCSKVKQIFELVPWENVSCCCHCQVFRQGLPKICEIMLWGSQKHRLSNRCRHFVLVGTFKFFSNSSKISVLSILLSASICVKQNRFLDHSKIDQGYFTGFFVAKRSYFFFRKCFFWYFFCLRKV